jgi:hypothetical protein
MDTVQNCGSYINSDTLEKYVSGNFGYYEHSLELAFIQSL